MEEKERKKEKKREGEANEKEKDEVLVSRGRQASLQRAR